MTSAVQQRVSLLAPRLQGGGLLSSQTLGTASTDAHCRDSNSPAHGTRGISLGHPGLCPPGGTTVYVVLDESPSVASADGNDPLSRRHHETALAIAHVASACRCKRDRVALVPFDLGSPGHVPPQQFTSAGMRRLWQGLRHLSSGYGLSSSLLPALAHVEQHAGTRGEATALVVFSDFLLTDQVPTAVMDRLCAFPGAVHAIVLGASPPLVFATHPGIATTRLTPSSAPGAAACAVFKGLTHLRMHTTSGRGSTAPRAGQQLQ